MKRIDRINNYQVNYSLFGSWMTLRSMYYIRGCVRSLEYTSCLDEDVGGTATRVSDTLH